MKKIILLLLITTVAWGQKTEILLPDSTEIIIFKDYQDSVQKVLNENSGFVETLLKNNKSYFDNDFQYKRFSEITIDALEMELFDLRSSQLKQIEAGLKESFLKKYLIDEVQNQYWHLIFAYPVVRANADQKSKRLTSVPAVITRGFNPKVLAPEEILKSKAGRKLINQWVTYENSRQNNFEKYTNLLLGTNDKVEFALQNLKGLVADYALAQILMANQLYLSNSLAQNIISQISNESIRSQFTGAFLDQIFAVNQEKESKKVVESSTKPGIYSFDFIDLKGKAFNLEKYKGKIVYLDFWASWCGPCRAQFPYSKKLHDQIPAKLKKKIVFLYISIDDTPEKWKEGVESIGLEEYENGFTEGAWGSPVLQQLGVRSIPRYMILGKDGKILNSNAARPSSPEILPELIQLAE